MASYGFVRGVEDSSILIGYHANVYDPVHLSREQGSAYMYPRHIVFAPILAQKDGGVDRNFAAVQ